MHRRRKKLHAISIPSGDVEPCVFIHYSGANIREVSLLECTAASRCSWLTVTVSRSTTTMLRPCPMLENPELLREMVHKTGAKSTDLQSPESVDHLCDKCENYAENWAGKAKEIWD